MVGVIPRNASLGSRASSKLISSVMGTRKYKLPSYIDICSLRILNGHPCGRSTTIAGVATSSLITMAVTSLQSRHGQITFVHGLPISKRSFWLAAIPHPDLLDE